MSVSWSGVICRALFVGRSLFTFLGSYRNTIRWKMGAGKASRFFPFLPRIDYDEKDPARPVVLVSLEGIVRAKDDDLAGIENVPEVALLRLRATQISNVGMRHCANLRNLTTVQLSSTKVTDGVLELVVQSPEINYINLIETKITDRGLAVLGEFKNLSGLELNYTAITDEALPQIAKCPSLDHLSIGETTVTGSTIKELAKCPKLGNLYLGLGKFDVKYLPDLKELKALKALDLSGMTLKQSDLELIRSWHLTTLHLGGAKFPEDAMEPQVRANFFREPTIYTDKVSWFSKKPSDGAFALR
ncbi:MAG TPA: hypothetical protein VFE24_04275 [Pirellulales bacterium]|nr:hypothetical protein [Pirellulales bacterium]